jgi:hypothetical protein
MRLNPERLFGIALVSCILSVVACSKTQFVVLRNVPESPSVTVIPANDYLREVEFANNVEEAIIGAGVKVVMRPSTKEVTTEKEVQETEGNRAAEAKLTERYFAWEDVQADYIVQTYVTSRQMKITKKQTREVLAVLVVPTYHASQEWREKVLYDALAKMGFPVAKKQK